MLTHLINHLVSLAFALSALLIAGSLVGCSSSGQNAAYTPYQANYQPAPQYQPYGSYAPPNANWNQAGFTNVGAAGQMQSFNSTGFSGQSC